MPARFGDRREERGEENVLRRRANTWGATLFRTLAGVGLAGTYMPGLKALADHMPERHESPAVAFYTVHFAIGISLS